MRGGWIQVSAFLKLSELGTAAEPAEKAAILGSALIYPKRSVPPTESRTKPAKPAKSVPCRKRRATAVRACRKIGETPLVSPIHLL